ncbi:MAG TPA: hypothetical protein VJQ81_08705, partial [Reyranella sp.]|nr:hypothetical protein [Reyranella sp.]
RGGAPFRRATPGGRRGRFDDGPPAWFAEGAALRVAAQDLDTGRRERVLLGAVLARPAWLHPLVEEMAALPLGGTDLQRLRAIMLDVAGLALSVDDGADETLEALEIRTVMAQAEQAGLAAVVAGLRREAELWLGTTDPEAALAQWHHIAARHCAVVADAADRRAAAADLADSTAENIDQSRALIERTLHSAKSSPEG